MAALARCPRSDHQKRCIPARPIDQMMAIGDTRRKRCRIAGSQHRLAIRFDQHQLAFEHIDEFVLRLVPMTLRRGGTRLEPDQLDAELRQAAGIAERLGVPPDHRVAERGGVARPAVLRHRAEVYLRHQTLSMMVAVPIPAPMQSVTSAEARLRRSSSSSTVPRIIAPVAPSGCPMAMAPPATFTLSRSSSRSCA